jgi:hypothetical protein
MSLNICKAGAGLQTFATGRDSGLLAGPPVGQVAAEPRRRGRSRQDKPELPPKLIHGAPAKSSGDRE